MVLVKRCAGPIVLVRKSLDIDTVLSIRAVVVGRQGARGIQTECDVAEAIGCIRGIVQLLALKLIAVCDEHTATATATAATATATVTATAPARMRQSPAQHMKDNPNTASASG